MDIATAVRRCHWGCCMEDNQTILLEFVERLHASGDIDSQFDALEHAVQQLGFEQVSFTYVPDLLNRLLANLSPVFKLSRNYRVDFIEHYQASHFGQHDFTIKKIARGELDPVHWWEMARQQRLSPEEQHVIEVARQDYGLRHGITIPVFADGENIAGVSVTSSEPDHPFDLLYQERVRILSLIARLFSDRVLQHPQNRALFFKPFLNGLSATEKSVLKLLAQGNNLKSIANHLQLDYKYLANNVIASLRRKFGDVSRDQLMYQAGKIEFDRLINTPQNAE